MPLSSPSRLIFSRAKVSPTPDKGDYTLFYPTPDADLRSFNTDRPPKANSPYTVDAGHFQYETDLVVFGYGNTDGVPAADAIAAVEKLNTSMPRAEATVRQATVVLLERRQRSYRWELLSQVPLTGTA